MDSGIMAAGSGGSLTMGLEKMLACTLTRICPSKLLLLVEERVDALGAYFGVERSFNLIIK
jgi:hypothetical protein